MATKQINQYPAAISIDGAADYLLIDPGGSGTYNKINRNVLLGITSTPIGAADSQTLSNKTLDNSNIITIKDANLTVQNSSDTTKRAVFSASGITTGTTRTLTLPNRTDTLVTLAGTETLTNKTITSPTITGGTIDNSAITVDSISGQTSATQVTVGGVLMNNGVIGTSGAVTATSIAAGGVQPQALQSGTGTGWSWSTWSPTWTNLTVGNGTLVAKYIQIGKTVFVRLGLVFGNTSAISGGVTFTLPVTAAALASASNMEIVGSALVTDNSSNLINGYVALTSTTKGILRVETASGSYVNLSDISSTVPFTWATGYIVGLSFVYEAA